MVADDPLASPRRRLTRAKKKFGALKNRGRIFAEKRPYALVTEADPHSGLEFYKLKITRILPAGTRELAWEIIEELRSALDQIGYASAVAGGKISPKNTYFPIADSAAQLETDVIGRGRCKDIPPDILTVFRSFKPYKGGNDAIWTLNRLRNGNQHRFIIPAGAIAENSLQVHALMSVAGMSFYVPVWDREKNEMIVLSAPIGSQLKYDFEFASFIAFGEVEAVSGQPVIPILYTMIGEVESILLAAEAECRRIGLIR